MGCPRPQTRGSPGLISSSHTRKVRTQRITFFEQNGGSSHNRSLRGRRGSFQLTRQGSGENTTCVVNHETPTEETNIQETQLVPLSSGDILHENKAKSIAIYVSSGVIAAPERPTLQRDADLDLASEDPGLGGLVEKLRDASCRNFASLVVKDEETPSNQESHPKQWCRPTHDWWYRPRREYENRRFASISACKTQNKRDSGAPCVYDRGISN
jgi:hypothetical protein